MDKTPYCYVVDTEGNYITLVLMGAQFDGSAAPLNRALQPGETLIDAPPIDNILKPRWGGEDWKETASPDEIAAAAPPPSQSVPL